VDVQDAEVSLKEWSIVGQHSDGDSRLCEAFESGFHITEEPDELSSGKPAIDRCGLALVVLRAPQAFEDMGTNPQNALPVSSSGVLLQPPMRFLRLVAAVCNPGMRACIC
jgi:hypothetical protein